MLPTIIALVLIIAYVMWLIGEFVGSMPRWLAKASFIAMMTCLVILAASGSAILDAFT
jgi:hypothetical protein